MSQSQETIAKTTDVSADELSSLHNRLTQKLKTKLDDFSHIGQEALRQFGSRLLRAMTAP
jgi:hypothetical protein